MMTISGIGIDITGLLDNPVVLQCVIGVVVATASYLFKKLGLTIDAELIRETCQEAVYYLKNRADSERDETGKINLYQAEILLNEAIMQVRNRLKNKKPAWLPKFIWNWALNKVSTHLIKTMIEGALELTKKI